MMHARRDGACRACRARILAGSVIEWSPGIGARCVDCIRRGIFPHVVNSKPQGCARCGLEVLPGAGLLTWRDIYGEPLPPSLRGEFIRRDWIVRHLDPPGCPKEKTPEV